MSNKDSINTSKHLQIKMNPSLIKRPALRPTDPLVNWGEFILIHMLFPLRLLSPNTLKQTDAHLQSLSYE